MRWKARTNDGDELDKGAALVEPFWGIASPDSPTMKEVGTGVFSYGPQQHVTALLNSC